MVYMYMFTKQFDSRIYITHDLILIIVIIFLDEMIILPNWKEL